MGSIIIREFHDALNAVSQPTTKPMGMADAMSNVIVSTRNTVAKKAGTEPINSAGVAFGSGAEILSIYDFLFHDEQIVRKHMFQAGTELFDLDQASGVAGVIKTGLTPQSFQYEVSGKAVYMGNAFNMLKYYSIAGYGLFSNSTLNVTDIYESGRSSFAQSFVSEHGKDRNCASISIGLQRVGIIPASTLLTLELQLDDGGSPGEPDGTPIANGVSNAIPGDGVPTHWNGTTFTFGSTLPRILAGVKYWWVFKTSIRLPTDSKLNTAVDNRGSSVHGFTSGNLSVFDGVWVDQPNSVSGFRIFVEPDLWGIEAPANAPTLATTTVLNPVYDTPGDQDNDAVLTNVPPGGSAELAQSWQFSGTDDRTISAISLFLKKTGLPLGNLQLTIRNDVDGRPGASVLMAFPVVPMSGLTGSYVFTEFTTQDPVIFRANTKYWIHLSGDLAYIDEFDPGVTSAEWGVDTSTPTFNSGEFALKAGGALTWTIRVDIDALFKVTSSTQNAGGRKYAYSFKNSVTGHVSNRSPGSDASGNFDFVDISTFEQPTDPQVDKIILWATTDGGEIFFKLAEDVVNTGEGAPSLETYNDGPITEDDLDFTQEAPLCNFIAPFGSIVSKARDSIVLAGVRAAGHKAFYSAGLGQTLVGVPEESFPAFNFITIPAGSERIFAINSLDGAPILFTTDELFTIAGETPETFRAVGLRGGKGIGSVSKDATVATEIGLFFMSTDRKVYLMPTISHIPMLVSLVVEDVFENISTDASLIEVRSMEKLKMVYWSFGERHWIVISIPTGGDSALNNELWIFDLDLHHFHPGKGWMGPLTLEGGQGYQALRVIEDPVKRKRLFMGDEGGFIREYGVGNQDDGQDFSASYTFPLMDDNKPDIVKDGLVIELIVPAGQAVPAAFLRVSYDSEDDFEIIPMVQVSEMERDPSTSLKYRGYLMSQFTRIKVKVDFTAADAPGEILQLRIDYDDLYSTRGFIHDATA